MATQYVQHMSGQGEKWALHHDYTLSNSRPGATAYVVENKTQGYSELRLPRSEYVLCEPPPPVVHWRDVTAECKIDADGVVTHHGEYTTKREDYRRRKVQLWQTHGHGGIANHPMTAIIIEQKVTE